ncbi:CcdC family protein [Virgibacillus sp. DJP39]|uniref:CcdC family protein n=1 Tax=Virgibacillus sp. DJP39 TaxID=3409790 RepID=UPI003BB5D042
MFWVIVSSIGAMCMAVLAIFLRLKSAKKPASVKKIILPPLFMSTGALMFIFPEFRIEWSQVLEALLVGIAFSILLIYGSKFEIKQNNIYLIPSKSFALILFGLLLLRIILKLALSGSISLYETSGMFFLLAFGMIISWRIAMLIKYKKLEKRLKYTEVH